MVLVNTTTKTTVSDRCHFANSVRKRMVGLLNRKVLPPGEGLLLDRCYGIHTIGMRFAIDVLFLDKNLCVIRAVKSLPPFRTCVVRQAVYVLELPRGTIERTGTATGHQIQIRAADGESEPAPARSLAATETPRSVLGQ